MFELMFGFQKETHGMTEDLPVGIMMRHFSGVEYIGQFVANKSGLTAPQDTAGLGEFATFDLTTCVINKLITHILCTQYN